MMSSIRQPTAREVDQFTGLAIAMLLERRPDLVDEVTGVLRDGRAVDEVVRHQVVELAERYLAAS